MCLPIIRKYIIYMLKDINNHVRESVISKNNE